MMYSEWYDVCDFIVLSVVEVCVDYGGVNVYHVCLDFCVGVSYVCRHDILRATRSRSGSFQCKSHIRLKF